MFGAESGVLTERPLRLHRWPVAVAGETQAAYSAAADETSRAVRPAGLAGALGPLEDAIDDIAAVDLGGEDDRALLDAVQECERLTACLAAQQLRLLGAVQRRQAYGLDGAVTCASWYRNRTRLDHGEATRRVQAATRLWAFPQLSQALACGNITPAHVMAVTKAAVPNRIEAIAAHEDTLVELALAASPRELGVALRRIAEVVDADGVDETEARGCARDPRCELDIRSAFDGLGELHAWMSQVDLELLLILLDALDEPDPSDTPVHLRRSPGQRRADAFGRLLRLAADAGHGPTVNGVKPHLLLSIDLAELLGIPADHPDAAQIAERLSDLLAAGGTDAGDVAALLLAAGDRHVTTGSAESSSDGASARRPAARPHDADSASPSPPATDLRDLVAPDAAAAAKQPRLRRTGRLDLDTARHLALDAKVTAVLTMGPWRIVNVGRTMRTLPGWLRPMLEMVHQHCRGPDCDRPATWTEAHHVQSWTADDGDTDLNSTVPLCKAHHDLVTSGRWRLQVDPGTGVCTWSPRGGGTTRTTRPPPR